MGSRVEMGRYPTVSPPGPHDFGDWIVKHHDVISVLSPIPGGVAVVAGAEGQVFVRQEDTSPGVEVHLYREQVGSAGSRFEDQRQRSVGADLIATLADPPSRPTIPRVGDNAGRGVADDAFIHVWVGLP